MTQAGAGGAFKLGKVNFSAAKNDGRGRPGGKVEGGEYLYFSKKKRKSEKGKACCREMAKVRPDCGTDRGCTEKT